MEVLWLEAKGHQASAVCLVSGRQDVSMLFSTGDLSMRRLAAASRLFGQLSLQLIPLKSALPGLGAGRPVVQLDGLCC